MAIIINNTSSVRKMAQDVVMETEKIKSANGSISYVLGELNEYWAANQEDQQVFYKGLEESVEALETVVQCNKEFSNAVVEYMDVTDKTSANAV